MKHLHIWRLVILSTRVLPFLISLLAFFPFSFSALLQAVVAVLMGRCGDFHPVLSPLSSYHLSKGGMFDSTWMSLHWHTITNYSQQFRVHSMNSNGERLDNPVITSPCGIGQSVFPHIPLPCHDPLLCSGSFPSLSLQAITCSVPMFYCSQKSYLE